MHGQALLPFLLTPLTWLTCSSLRKSFTALLANSGPLILNLCTYSSYSKGLTFSLERTALQGIEDVPRLYPC